MLIWKALLTCWLEKTTAVHDGPPRTQGADRQCRRQLCTASLYQGPSYILQVYSRGGGCSMFVLLRTAEATKKGGRVHKSDDPQYRWLWPCSTAGPAITTMQQATDLSHHRHRPVYILSSRPLQPKQRHSKQRTTKSSPSAAISGS